MCLGAKPSGRPAAPNRTSIRRMLFLLATAKLTSGSDSGWTWAIPNLRIGGREPVRPERIYSRPRGAVPHPPAGYVLAHCFGLPFQGSFVPPIGDAPKSSKSSFSCRCFSYTPPPTS